MSDKDFMSIFALFQIQVEGLFGDAIELRQLGQSSKIIQCH